MTNPTEPEPCEKPSANRYRKGICRCSACHKLAKIVMHRYAMRKLHGKVKNYSAAEARMLLKRTLKRGVTCVEISEMTGLNVSYLRAFVKGPRAYGRAAATTVTSRTWNGIVQAEKVTRGRKKTETSQQRMTYVDADRTRRAIQGLMLQGYSYRNIADRIEAISGKTYSEQHLGTIITGQPTVHKTTEAWVVQVAQEVGFNQGTSKRTKYLAEKRGYKPLLEWDDLM